MAHIERKAKIKMLHERDMKKLQSQVVSKNVLDRKVALAAARDAEALAKAQAKDAAEIKALEDEIERRQLRHAELKPQYIKR